jgi:DHA2 family multidrug resistance protein
VDGSVHRHVNPWIVTISVMMATFMELLDTTVANVSIPIVQAIWRRRLKEGTWVVTSYLVANVGILPMSSDWPCYLGARSCC